MFPPTRQDVWKIVENALKSDNPQIEFKRIYDSDTRTNKGRSIAYLRAFRTAMLKNEAVTAKSIYLTIKAEMNIGVILRSLEIDYRRKSGPFDAFHPRSMSPTIYTVILESIGDDYPKIVAAYLAVQIITAPAKRDVLTNLSVVVEEDRNYDAWEVLADYASYDTAISKAMSRRLDSSDANKLKEKFEALYIISSNFENPARERAFLISEVEGLLTKEEIDTIVMSATAKSHRRSPKEKADILTLNGIFFEHWSKGINNSTDFNSLLEALNSINTVNEDIRARYLRIANDRYGYLLR